MKKHFLDRKDCCGCAACAQVCPRHCIGMSSDAEGFLYPVIDAEQCVDCHLCEKVCPVLHPSDERLPLKVYGAVSHDREEQEQSSSGGVFSVLAHEVLRTGGVVFGARYDDQWQVKLDYVTTEGQLSLLRGSKYVQARVDNAYIDALRFLKEGRNVLFSGTPCQIAGLRHFLRDKYDNLLTVDVACHGVPSPKVWSDYLESATRLANRKKTGTLVSAHDRNPYMRAFLDNLILRPSCYHCKMKGGRSGSDITIADFWGVQQLYPSIYDDRGTSLILVNSSCGLEAFQRLPLRRQEVTYDAVLRDNPAIIQSYTRNPKRDYFFAELQKTNDVTTLIETCFRLPVVRRVKQMVRQLTERLKGFHGAPADVFEKTSSLPAAGWTKEHISHVNFRSKRRGWEEFCLEIKWENRAQT